MADFPVPLHDRKHSDAKSESAAFIPASNPTARAALATCAFFALVACILAAPAVAPRSHAAYAAPVLSVDFDAATGIAKWTAGEGVTAYWCGCSDKLETATDWEHHNVSTSVTVDHTGKCTYDFKSAIEGAVSRGDMQPVSVYALEVFAADGDEAKWSSDFDYKPVSGPYEVLDATLDTSTGKLSWTAVSGADFYWCEVDDRSEPIKGTSVDLAGIIDDMYSKGNVDKKDTYKIAVLARKGDVLLAKWTGTFAYTPKKVSDQVTISGDPAAKLPVTFKKKTGKATWKAYSGAKAYFAVVDGIGCAALGKSANFKAIIDGLYLGGSVKKKSSYKIEVLAYSKGSKNLLAKWKTTFKYKPAPNLSRATVEAIPDQPFVGKKVKPKLQLYIGDKLLKKGKHYTVSFKNNAKIGKATAVIKGKGKVKGTLKKTFKVVPASPSIKVTSLSVGAATVDWTHQTKSVDGVQIKYGYNSKMKKTKGKTIEGTAQTSLSISKLRADKTTFVWIRSFKTVGGKKYYSEWNSIWFSVL